MAVLRDGALAYGILVPQPGIEPRVLALIVLATGLPGNSPYDLPNSIPSLRKDPSTPDHI